MFSKIQPMLREARATYALRKQYKSFIGIRAGDKFEYLQAPEALWATKSHAFWVLLPLMLHKTRPREIAELGSGRSIIYLSEYAAKHQQRLISIDDDPKWVAAGNLVCRFGGLPGDFIKHVPSSKTEQQEFYDLEGLAEHIEQPDFLFLDGPVHRKLDAAGMAFVCRMAAQAEVIIIDDVHRRVVFEQIAPLMAASGCEHRFFHEYDVSPKFRNALVILANNRTRPLIAQAMDFIEFPLTADYSEQNCAE